MSVKGSPCMFGPEELRAEIVGQWGPAGAHVEVFDDLLRRVEVAERRYTDMAKRGTWKEAQEYSEYWRLVAEKAERELAEAQGDAERFEWWFSSDVDKRNFMPTYFHGIRERWSLSNWRAAIDAERGK